MKKVCDYIEEHHYNHEAEVDRSVYGANHKFRMIYQHKKNIDTMLIPFKNTKIDLKKTLINVFDDELDHMTFVGDTKIPNHL